MHGRTRLLLFSCLSLAAVARAGDILYDDFSTCYATPDPSRWFLVTRQWGGVDINGGVVPANVKCAYDSSLSKQVLALEAHGDLFNGTGPNGVKDDGSERGASEIFKGWAWGAYEPVGRGCAPYCNVRRVGAAVRSQMTFSTASTLEARIKPCPSFGAVTALWLFNYTEHYCNSAGGDTCEQDYRDWCCGGQPCDADNDSCEGVWIANNEADIELPSAGSAARAGTANPFYISFDNVRFSSYTALASGGGKCSDNPPCEAHDYVSPGAQNDGDYHVYRFDWDPDAKVIKYFIDGNQLDTIQGVELVPELGQLWLGLWFPNAWAGSPSFDTCTMYVDYVRVSSL